MIGSTGIWREGTSSANAGALVWSRADYTRLYSGGVHALNRIPDSERFLGRRGRLQCS